MPTSATGVVVESATEDDPCNELSGLAHRQECYVATLATVGAASLSTTIVVDVVIMMRPCHTIRGVGLAMKMMMGAIAMFVNRSDSDNLR